MNEQLEVRQAREHVTVDWTSPIGLMFAARKAIRNDGTLLKAVVYLPYIPDGLTIALALEYAESLRIIANVADQLNNLITTISDFEKTFIVTSRLASGITVRKVEG